MEQSTKGFKSFSKFYKKSIIYNFPNYYLIAKKSKVNLKKYLKFCKKSKFRFRNLDLSNFILKTNNIVGGVKVEEPIYDWAKLKKEVNKKIKKFKTNDIKLNTKITKIGKDKGNFVLFSKSKNIKTNIIVDATYNFSNSLSKYIIKKQKFKYQLVFVKKIKLKNFQKLGIAVMDGKFFSFLPEGSSNNHLLYHVKHSIIREKISNEFNSNWLNIKKYKKQIKILENKMYKDLKEYFPSLNFSFLKKNYISPRLILANVDKTDRRSSSVKEISKNYFRIISGKVDHSVDIANKLLKLLK